MECAEAMEKLAGSLGTSASLGLRMVEAICSIAALLFMSSALRFYQYTSFCFLAVVMGLLITWSLILATVDGFLVFIQALTRRPRIILVVVIIDWIFAILSLAASCATTSSADFLFPNDNSRDVTSWSPYHISAAAAFLCSMLMCGSALSNLWILPRL